MDLPLTTVDVFGTGPLSGNPVAVVLEADELTPAQMAAFARWTNLSETTFVLEPTRPEADYRVRIFTPSGELPFAGHPTLGTCHAWWHHRQSEASDVGRAAAPTPGETFVQECAAGLVPVRVVEDGVLAFAAPPDRRTGPVDEALLPGIAAQLRIDPADVVRAVWADNGPGWIAVELASAEAVLAVRPGPTAPGADEAFVVRTFFPVDGATREDPVTGSFNASLARLLVGEGRIATPYLVAQGAALGRAGRVRVDAADGDLWIGGRTVTVVHGFVPAEVWRASA